MGQIQRLTRGRVKPYNSLPRIDWSHPLAVGLSTYCYDVGGVIVDLVNDTKITMGANGTAPFGSHTHPYGRGLQIPVDGWGFMPPQPASKLPSLGMVSPYSAALATYYVGAGGTASPDGAIISVQDANNSESTQFGFNYFPTDPSSGNNDSIGAVFDDTVSPGYIPFNTLFAANTYQAWGISATTSTFANMYANGVLDKTNSASVNSPPGHVSAPQIMVNTASINSGQQFGNIVNGFILYFAMWGGRALSANEHLQLSNDPYCFLIYPEDEMFATLVGVVGGNIFNDSVTEAGTASDAGSASAVFATADSETGIAVDTPSASAVFAASDTEAGTATDTAAGAWVTSSTITEAGTAADSETVTASFASSITEANSAADSYVNTAVFVASDTEAGSASDSPSSTAIFAASDTEAASAADSESSTGAVISDGVIEAATAADTETAIVTFVAAASEAGSAADASSNTAIFSASASEAGSAGDAEDANGVFVASDTEGATATDLSNGVIPGPPSTDGPHSNPFFATPGPMTSLP